MLTDIKVVSDDEKIGKDILKLKDCMCIIYVYIYIYIYIYIIEQ